MTPAEAFLLTFPERLVFLATLIFFAGLALRTYIRRFALVRQGRATAGGDSDLAGSLRRFLQYVPGQWSNISNISRSDLGGAQHFILFWSLICFAVYYLLFLVLGEGLGIIAPAGESGPAHAFLLLVEVLGLVLLAALGWGLARRSWMRPARLGPDYEVSLFLFITVAAGLLLLSFYGLGALRFTLGMTGHSGPITGPLAGLLQTWDIGPASQGLLFHFLWWLQAAIIACFLLYIPFSDHQHALFAPVNIFVSEPQKTQGRIAARAMDRNYHGLTGLGDFTWKQLLELYGCAQCGRCQDACPAVAAGKALSPKKVIQNLRVWMDDTGHIQPFWKEKKNAIESDSPAARFSDEEIWSCNTCMACLEACPAFVAPLDKIVDLRRDRVMARSSLYPETIRLFRDLENFGDTFGKGSAGREDWAIGQNIKVLTENNGTDCLFWVGCQATFDDRGQSNGVRLAKVLQDCGIDLAILGRRESCCGDPLRRLGNEYQFAAFAERNIATLKKLNFKRIVTYCPHCHNVLKNEYPQFGGQFEVVHYTEILEELLARGTLKMKSSAATRITYHDPCYLARGNNITSGHTVLAGMPGLMPQPLLRSGCNTFCCGGGGGAMWMREFGTAKVGELRVKQLAETAPDVIATSCPYCLIMLEDGVKSLGMDHVQCKDLIELVTTAVTVEEKNS